MLQGAFHLQVHADFARKLERERDKLRAKVARLEHVMTTGKALLAAWDVPWSAEGNWGTQYDEALQPFRAAIARAKQP